MTLQELEPPQSLDEMVFADQEAKTLDETEQATLERTAEATRKAIAFMRGVNENTL